MKREPLERVSSNLWPQNSGRRSIGDVVCFEAAVSLSYGVLIIGFAADTEGLGASLVRWWIGFTSGITRLLLVLVPDPSDLVGSDHASEVAVYRHVLVFSLLIACAIFAAFRAQRPHWAAHAKASLARLSPPGQSPGQAARIGHCHMLQGLVATVLALLYGERYLGSAAALLFAEPWTFLRAPLLATLAFAFACHATALRRCMARHGRPL